MGGLAGRPSWGILPSTSLVKGDNTDSGVGLLSGPGVGVLDHSLTFAIFLLYWVWAVGPGSLALGTGSILGQIME